MNSISLTPIRDMFDSLVPNYDRFNRLSSLGLDGLWRRRVVRLFQPDSLVLDIGTGTGDLAKELLNHHHRVIGVDFSGKMIHAAREKLGSRVDARFEVAQADDLPFESATFDGVCSAFVIRNLHQGGVLSPSLREFHRVLKEGGQMVHLELTRPPRGLLAGGHRFYLKAILPLIGRQIFREHWPDNYLVKTIQGFPPPSILSQRLRWAGFGRVCHYSLSGGVASLFVGSKC